MQGRHADPVFKFQAAHLDRFKKHRDRLLDHVTMQNNCFNSSKTKKKPFFENFRELQE